MTVTSVDKDPAALTMSITSEFDAPIERVWEVWSDPRQLEQWWGPPTHPATVVDHDLSPGARVTYFMTGPEGEKYHGWWRVLAVDAPQQLDFEDGFADENGEPNEEMPTTTTQVRLDSPAPGKTRMLIVTEFPSQEAMEQLLAMGVEEGMMQALGQVDALIAERSTT